MNRTYLYGIVAGADEAGLGVVGVGGAGRVRIVAHEGLGCVTSAYRGQAFQALPREGIVRNLLAHQQVVERVMRDRPVLPVKFGTLVRNRGDACALLSQAHSQFADALAYLEDKVEIEVAATWDVSRVLGEIGQEAEVVRAREAATRNGEPSLAERVGLGQIAKACLDRRRDSYRARMADVLVPLSVDVAPNPLISDELVMNVAFLVERPRQREFDERIRQLDEAFRNEITFRVIGPLPAYSFRTVEVTRFRPRQLEAARRMLHLGEGFGEREVRQAYRRLAAKQQHDPETVHDRPTAYFSRPREASELLLRYCRARQGAREAVLDPAGGGLFAVAIKDSRSDEVEPARFGANGRPHHPARTLSSGIERTQRS